MKRLLREALQFPPDYPLSEWGRIYRARFLLVVFALFVEASLIVIVFGIAVLLGYGR